MIEDESALLSTLSQEHILHMMPQFSVHLLDLLLSVPWQIVLLSTSQRSDRFCKWF